MDFNLPHSSPSPNVFHCPLGIYPAVAGTAPKRGALEEIWGGGSGARGITVGQWRVSMCQLSGWHSGSSGEKPLCQLAESTLNPKGN